MVVEFDIANSGYRNQEIGQECKTLPNMEERLGETGTRMIDKTMRSLGLPLWQWSSYRDVLKGGKLAGADVVSQILESAGISEIYSLNGYALMQKVEKSERFEEIPLEERRPADLVFGIRQGFGRSPHSTVGIVTSKDRVAINSASKGIFMEKSFEVVYSADKPFQEKRVFRPRDI